MAATDQTVNPTLSIVPTDEERMLRETVRKICADFGPAYSRRKTAAGEPPTELWDALATRGYLGVNLPEEYGGGGLGMSALAAVGEEISASGCSLLLIVVSPAIVGSILVRHGNEEQKDTWLRGIAAGTTKVAFAITEPGAGSNSHNLSTAARRANGSYLIRGEKTYISGVEDSDAILVVTRARDDDGNLGLPLLFIVDSDAPGLTKQHIPTALQAPDKQWTLFFDDVEVGADRLVGSTASTPNASWARRWRAARGAGRSRWRPATRASASCGRARSAPTRASRTRSRRPRSSSSWHA
jgi:alkylation response protein AidB-like acyl-CoA dehydrogenase